ncbi:unnamed protein product [Malus baccata var. baccata]
MAQSLISVFSLWLIVFLGCMLRLHECFEPTVPAIYVFGDSTVDVGTYHYLPQSRARADFPFNGIDFPHSTPTGRFSNGFNLVDYLGISPATDPTYIIIIITNFFGQLIFISLMCYLLANFLGFELSPPPFLLLDEIENGKIRLLTKGVNFASEGHVVAFGEQVEQFARVHDIISKLQGESGLANMSKSLFLFSVGGNDIFEHFLFNNTTSAKVFIATLMSTYESRLRQKKIGIISVPPVGCVPLQRNSAKDGSRSEPMNEYAKLFYKALQGMICALADAYTLATQIIKDPKNFGFDEEATKACCGKGNFNAKYPCKPDSYLCEDRDVYLFWDQFHLTQAASLLAALALHAGGGFVAPMTFGQLALLA